MREYRAIPSGQLGKCHREVIEDNVVMPSAYVPAETYHLISPYRSDSFVRNYDCVWTTTSRVF